MQCSRILLGKVPRSIKVAFKLLGASLDSDSKELKSSFRLQARKYHPDLNGGDDTKMKELNKAYATVLKHNEECKVKASVTHRDDENRTKKEAEVKLVHRLSRWMQQREDVDKEYGTEGTSPRSPRIELDNKPFEDHKSHMAYDKQSEKQFAKILGSEEDQLKWAEQFTHRHSERLKEKNKSKKGVDPKLIRKLTPTRRQLYDDCLNTLGARDRLLYEKVPEIKPSLSINGATDVNPFLLKGSRENPFIRKVQKADRKQFFTTKGIDILKKMSFDEMQTRKLNLERSKRRKEKLNKGDYIHSDMLKQLPAAAGASFFLPGERDINDVSSLGTRPHSSARRSGDLASFTTNVNGETKHIVVSKEEYIRKGYNIGS